MAMKKKAQKVVTSTVSLKAVDNAITVLVDAAASTKNAITIIAKEKKKLVAETKRLAKKQAVLMKKKKAAKAKLKMDASAANTKAVKAIEKEMLAIKKMVAKIVPSKSGMLEELKALKDVSRRAAAYAKAVNGANKALSSPKKKRRKRRTVKK